MDFLTLANTLIPGYETLSQNKRTAFENTAAGQQFTQLIHQTLTVIQELDTSLRWWLYLNGTASQKKKAQQDQFEQNKTALFTQIKDSDDYKTIQAQISYHLLKNEYPDFSLLSKENRMLLAQQELSQQLVTSVFKQDQLIQHAMQELEMLDPWSLMNTPGTMLIQQIRELESNRVDVIDYWIELFLNNDEMRAFVDNIQQQKELLHQQLVAQKLALLSDRADQLGKLFPLLHYRFSADEPSALETLMGLYVLENGDVTTFPEKLEKDVLTNLLFHCLQQLNEVEITFINLDSFNKKRAALLADRILQAFNEGSELALEEWLDNYDTKLYMHLMKRFTLVNGQPWEKYKPRVNEELSHALSYLWSSKPAEKAREFLSKLADAHGVIQQLGFSTQNESSFLAIIDMYNYGRYYEQISEAKSVVQQLLSFFKPLYDEYKDLTFFEKNGLRKTVRAFIPLLIIAGGVVTASVLLAPLALPELAFTAVFIPVLIGSILLASKYVTWKNAISTYIRNWYYGGAFEIPEYQVTERMITALGKENAERIRSIYITELQICDQEEVAYHQRHQLAILDDEDFKARRDNLFKRHELCLEWYDISRNQRLSYEVVPKITQKRLQLINDEDHDDLLNQLQKPEEQRKIHESVTNVTQDLKTTLIAHNKPPANPDANIINTLHYTPGLFQRPRCLPIQKHMETLADLTNDIQLSC